MQNRRMTRLTNAYFVRPHGTLTKDAEGRKTTPAMKAGLTDHVWTMDELLEKIAGYETQGPVIPE